MPEGEREGRAADFPVVGIGASAGGLKAVEAFLRALPSDPGIAFVVVQHLDPDRSSKLAELLAKSAALPVTEAEHDAPLEPDHVFVMPPGNLLALRDGLLRLEPLPESGDRAHFEIDHFFRSLAEERGERAIGIVLSGMGTDGSLGLREIKGCGGMVMVQDPEHAEFDGMPRSAIATGQVDFTLRVEDMPTVLTRYVEHPYVGDALRA